MSNRYDKFTHTQKNAFAEGYMLSELENIEWTEALEEPSFTINIRDDISSMYLTHTAGDGEILKKHFTTTGNSFASLYELAILVQHYINNQND